MDQQAATASPANGASTTHDLFVLTDEQILEIEPEAAEAAPVEQPLLAVPARHADTTNEQSAAEPNGSVASSQLIENAQQSTQAGVPLPSEPPPWLAAQMTDPWTGADAKEFWNGVQQSKQETAAYRAAFATPEEARALKELYPGGINEARAVADRARLLDDIDRAYFGAAGGTPEQTGAARTQLAAMMLREDPAAFREMVFAGLRTLEEAEKGSTGAASAPGLPRLAQLFAANRNDSPSGAGATLASPATIVAASAPASAAVPAATNSGVGARHAVPASGNTPDAHVAAYAAFEKAANEDLERSVGAAITRTIQNALPNFKERGEEATEGARHGVPLQDRLRLAVRHDIEAALKGDRQLGEQIAQILSARRFDTETRTQVVRLIDDRARQLVPSAAKRVLNEWTQTTLAAHRGSVARADASSSRREVEPASSNSGRPSPAANSPRTLQTRTGTDPNRGAPRPNSRRVDYHKLSDEQILEL